ncbi:phage tail protein [Litoribacillus peritrichatus]|uniref:Tail fiber protein n=1 Tax=Litoribacillus peritrichatus TaxID=718191 RepID=A0ABP7MI89_9GAMM
MADPFMGEVGLFSFNFNPRGWFLCNGSLLSIASYSTLFSLLGTMYGGDGRTTFALPDLRGRAAMSKGRHPGSAFDWRMGTRAGAESHTLTVLELAAHSHTATFTATSGGSAAVVYASTDTANENIPATGSYLAVNKNGRLPGIDLYRPDAGTGTVELGGVSGGGGNGVVTVNNNGGSEAFSIIQPVLAMNYSMAYVGVYPPRS